MSSGVVCNVCNKTLTTKFGLKNHIKAVHEKIRPFSCEFCDSKFSLKSNRTRHVANVHQVKKPFVCRDCGKSFKLKIHLTEHILVIHIPDEESRIYSCNMCEKKFKRQQDLLRHMKSVHFKIKPFQCEHCKLCFTRKGHLEVHIKKIHKKNIGNFDRYENAKRISHKEKTMHKKPENISPQSDCNQLRWNFLISLTLWINKFLLIFSCFYFSFI